MKYFDLVNQSNLFKTKFIVYEIIKKWKFNHNSQRHNDRSTLKMRCLQNFMIFQEKHT